MSKLSKRATGLRSAVSVLAVAASLAFAGAAQAGCSGPAVTITSSSGATSVDGSPCPASVTVATGTTAVLTPSWGYQPNATNKGWVPLIDNSGPLDATGGSPQGGASVGPITVAQGATFVFGGEQTFNGAPYAPLNNVLNSAGDVVVEGNGGYEGGNQFALLGTNTITGNLTLEAGANFRIGEFYNQVSGAAMGQYAAGGEYDASTINFGPNTNVALQGASGAGQDTLLFLNLSAPAVIGGALSATTYSEVWLHAGTLTVNGADTAANPFVGTLQMDAGTTLIVGDSAHPGAVLGDPGNQQQTTPTFTLNVNGGGGNIETLKGYGTIYGVVNNNGGLVAPGGTAGVLGALTVSQYNQSATGILQVEVSPTGADALHVLGTANLAGTLQIKVDPGSYGNAIIPIITAGKINGSFASIETSGDIAAGLAITPTSYDVVTELTSSIQVFGHLVDADRNNITSFNDAIYDEETTSSKTNAPSITYSNGIEAWAEPFGAVTNVSHAGYGYNATSEGVIGGLEGKLPEFDGVAGVAFAYAGGNLKTDSGKTNSTSNTFNVALYGGFNTPNARIEATAFYNTYDANVSRNLGSSGTIDSSPTGKTYGASLQVSNPIYNGFLKPYLRVTFADIDQTAVTEGGTNLLALKVNGIEKGYFDGEFGFKVHPVFRYLPVNLHPEVTLAVQHDFTQNPGDLVSAQFANLSGSPFSFSWKGDQGTAGIAGLMLSSDVSSHFQVYGKVGGRFTTDGQTGELRLGGSYRF